MLGIRKSTSERVLCIGQGQCKLCQCSLIPWNRLRDWGNRSPSRNCVIIDSDACTCSNNKSYTAYINYLLLLHPRRVSSDGLRDLVIAFCPSLVHFPDANDMSLWNLAVVSVMLLLQYYNIWINAIWQLSTLCIMAITVCWQILCKLTSGNRLEIVTSDVVCTYIRHFVYQLHLISNGKLYFSCLLDLLYLTD